MRKERNLRKLEGDIKSIYKRYRAGFYRPNLLLVVEKRYMFDGATAVVIDDLIDETVVIETAPYWDFGKLLENIVTRKHYREIVEPTIEGVSGDYHEGLVSGANRSQIIVLKVVGYSIIISATLGARLLNYIETIISRRVG